MRATIGIGGRPMITRAEAERLAAATNDLRPDWPVAQLMTLIGELQNWPLRDLGVGLTYVALDMTIAGDWITKTPYRVKEPGPWRTIGVANADIEASRQRALVEAARRKDEIRTRNQAARNCQWCDDTGRLAEGQLCLHENPTERAQLAAERSAVARAAIRPTIRYEESA